MKGFKRGEKGFTLVELLIVVAILGVLAAVVIPNVVGLLGRGGSQAYETDSETIQLAVATFYADVHEGPDTATVPAVPTWSDNTANLGAGHWHPTEAGVSVAIVTATEDSAAADVTDDNNGNPMLIIDADSDGVVDAGEEVAAADIDDAAVWMGLLVNTAKAATAAGDSDRSTAAPWTSEDDLYLNEFPESSTTAYNGNPDPTGGTYTWVVGDRGVVYGVYSRTWDPPGAVLGAGTYWYAGFSGVYP